MFSRRVKTEPLGADKGITVVVRESVPALACAKTEVAAERKPSERFMRKTLQAKSKASRSERLRVADLANQLERTACDEGVINNGVVKFNSYRPGTGRPSG